MTIRPATADDVPAVLPLVQRVAAFHEKLDPVKYCYRTDPAEMYRDWLIRKSADRKAAFVVADAAGRGEPPNIIGFLVGTVEPEIGIYKLREYGFVHDLWVDPSYRNEGVARQLVMQAVERFTQIGVKQVRLDVLVGNEPARKLFERCGFRASVVEMVLEVEGPPTP